MSSRHIHAVLYVIHADNHIRCVPRFQFQQDSRLWNKYATGHAIFFVKIFHLQKYQYFMIMSNVVYVDVCSFSFKYDYTSFMSILHANNIEYTEHWQRLFVNTVRKMIPCVCMMWFKQGLLYQNILSEFCLLLSYSSTGQQQKYLLCVE